MKTTARIIGVCALILALAACASGGSPSGTVKQTQDSVTEQTDSGTVKQTQGSVTVQTGERVHTAEYLPSSEGDIAIYPEMGPNDNSLQYSDAIFSPEGKYFLIKKGPSIVMWDVESGRSLRKFFSDRQLVLVIYSPDGKCVAATQSFGTAFFGIRIWDSESGQLLQYITTYASRIQFSPDGKLLVSWDTSSAESNIIRLWDVQNGTLLQEFTSPTVGIVDNVNFTPDGKYIFSVGRKEFDNRTIRKWDVQSGALLQELTSSIEGEIGRVYFTPDGKYILSVCYETIRTWDAQSGRECMVLSGHSILSEALSPDGKRMVTVEEDRTITMWDIENGRKLRTIDTGSLYATDISVSYSQNGKYFSTHSKRTFLTSLKIWDAETGELLKTISEGDFDVRWSPDGKHIMTYNNDRSILFDVENGRQIRVFEGHSVMAGFRMRGDITGLSFYGNYIASSSTDESIIRIWDIQNGRLLKIISDVCDGTSCCVALHPDGKRIAVQYADDTHMVKIWDIESARELQVFSWSGGTSGSVIRQMEYSPDGKHLAITYYNVSGAYSSSIWDAEKGLLLRTLSENAYIFVFSPDSKHITTTDGYQSVKIWEVETGKKILTYDKHVPSNGIRPAVHFLAYSPDGKNILSSAGNVYDTRVWNAENGSDIQTLEGYYNFNAGGKRYQNKLRISCAAYSPDGTTIVSSAHDDNVIGIWDVSTGKLKQMLSGHTDSIMFVQYSPDGKRIISSAMDHTIRIWDAASGRELVQLVSFSGNDTQFSAASRGLTVEAETASSTVDGEWVSLTPDGFYQASPRGDRYLNVRVNNTVSGIDSYRSVFYNPDVVQARIAGRPDPASKATVTIQQAASFIPPEIAIQSPENGSTTNNAQTRISVSINSDSQPIKNIKLLVNGRLLGGQELADFNGTVLKPERASLSVTGDYKELSFTMPVELDPGNNRIEVVAFNGYSDNRRYIDVTRNAPAGLTPRLPDLYLLAVGVNGYDNAGAKLQGLGNLNFAVSDAQGMVNSLKAQKGKRFGKVHTLLIADGQTTIPTAENIRKNLNFLEKADPRRDVVVLFLAGHGISGADGKFYFLPKDAAFTGTQLVDKNRAISEEDFMRVLDAPGNRLVFIDACQSGNVDSDRMVRMLMNSNAFIFAASRGNELSYEDPKLGHGYFTYSVMSALGGAPLAVTEDNHVSVMSMSGFVSLEVPRLTNNMQHPTASWLGFSDFPVAVIEK